MTNYTCLLDAGDDFTRLSDARLLQTIVDAKSELISIRGEEYPNQFDLMEQTNLILALFAERDRRGLESPNV